MKRKTVNQIGIIQPIRTLKKNKSCQLNPKQLRRFSKKINRRSGGQSITSSSVIIDLILHDLLENLEAELKISEQGRFNQNLFQLINKASIALQNMMDPFPYSGQKKFDNIVPQEEPRTIAGDFLCSGNNVASEIKASKNQRTSLTLLGQQKRQKNDYTAPKQSFSSKRLIKVPQEHVIQKSQGLKALKECLAQDVCEDIIRDKFMKDKKDIYFDLYKFEGISKTKVLPPIDEYSFDYDGSVFPIKNNVFRNSQKIKFLSTTCKLLNKQAIENRKQCIISRLQGEYIKTEIQEDQKQNKKDLPLQKKNISGRRQSNSDSIKNMMKIITQGDQINFKNKLQEIIYNKAAKIREIKTN